MSNIWKPQGLQWKCKMFSPCKGHHGRSTRITIKNRISAQSYMSIVEYTPKRIKTKGLNSHLYTHVSLSITDDNYKLEAN